MIASRHPVFARLGPKLDRAARELANLDAFLAQADVLPPGPATAWGRLTATATAVHNAYNGIEDVCLSIAAEVDGSVPAGDASHQGLLDQMRAPLPGLRPPLLDDDLHAALTELKGFRHRVRHRYGFDLDPARTEANRVLMVWALPRFVEAVRALERVSVGTRSGLDGSTGERPATPAKPEKNP